MARLFISYNHQDFAYAYAVRHWLIEHQGWTGNDIFVDASHLHTGVEWEKKLFAEAEAAEVMLFLASDTSLDRRSFCYKELQRAKGQILAVTIRGVSFQDERLGEVLPEFAKARQVTVLDEHHRGLSLRLACGSEHRLHRPKPDPDGRDRSHLAGTGRLPQ